MHSILMNLTPTEFDAIICCLIENAPQIGEKLCDECAAVIQSATGVIIIRVRDV